MFKFFSKSPKLPSPAPPPPAPAPSDPPPRSTNNSSSPSPPPSPTHAEGLHGLGLTVPEGHALGRLDNSAGGTQGRESRQGGGGGPAAGEQRRAAASRRNSAAPSPAADDPDGVVARNGLTSRVGTGGRRTEEGTTSPLSFDGSRRGGFESPYGSVMSRGFEARDPSQIYAPTTWSEMAHQELVSNLSSRERTRQEILWEVVASEERYVAELRSLVELYANPLLHPLAPSPLLTAPSPHLSSSSSPHLSSSPQFGSSPSPNPAFSSSTSSSNSSSSPELPIAARFARSTNSLASSVGGGGGGGRQVQLQSMADLSEILNNGEQQARRLGAQSPALPTGAVRDRNASVVSLDTAYASPPPQSHPQSFSSRLASFGFGRSSSSPSASSSAHHSRHPLRPPSSGAKLHKSVTQAPQEALLPPPLPEALKQVLEAVMEMLKGHEELSGRLKERWAKDFPLVRGLAAIWSDQPWFLSTYSSYVVSLEDALSVVDSLLPSSHSPALTSYASKFKSSTAGKSRGEKDEKKLNRVLLTLEERAAEAGESSLSICLSKPLMRLSKLPLLMQALLYHTDPTTHEWEKTRAMALEVDALVRSIEDEKIEEEERERTRDVLARIDGINDKALMAPRSSRIVLDELPAPDRSPASRSGKIGRKSCTSANGAAGGNRSTANDWLIRFTDVVIRAQKIGETSIPGSFSRDKEKKGKQGKTRKTGKLRNTYRFVRIERWELRDATDAALTDMDDLRRAITDDTLPRGAEFDEEDEAEDEDDMDGAESRMSFRYDSDDPQPAPAAPTAARRTFSSPSSTPATALRPKPSASSHLHVHHSSITTTTKPKANLRSSPLAPTTAKFGARLRLASEDAHGHGHGGMRVTSPVQRTAAGVARFASPTVASASKLHENGGRRAASTPTSHSSPQSNANAISGSRPLPVPSAAPPRTVPPPMASASTPVSATLGGQNGGGAGGGGGGGMPLSASTFGLYESWAQETT